MQSPNFSRSLKLNHSTNRHFLPFQSSLVFRSPLSFNCFFRVFFNIVLSSSLISPSFQGDLTIFYTGIFLKYISMITIQCKYNSVLILCAGQLGKLVKYISRLEGNNIVTNRTNLISTRNKYCCRYNRADLTYFGQTN